MKIGFIAQPFHSGNANFHHNRSTAILGKVAGPASTPGKLTPVVAQMIQNPVIQPALMTQEQFRQSVVANNILPYPELL